MKSRNYIYYLFKVFLGRVVHVDNFFYDSSLLLNSIFFGCWIGIIAFFFKGLQLLRCLYSFLSCQS